MSDQYSMFPPATLPDSPNAISSPGSASGPTPSDAPVGPTTAPSAPAPALASLSARQAKERGLLTSGTYGRVSSISSASAALSRSLANRLARKTALLGSTMYALTWKERVTPWGYRIPALRASALRTSDSGCTSWPTPRTPTGGPESGERKKELGRTESGGGDLQAVALMASWPTPRSEDGESSGMRHSRGVADTLTAMASWSTPSSRDWKDTPGMSKTGINPDGSKRTRLDQLPRQAQLMVSGGGQVGSPAETGKYGQLNPAHSRWLMGLPPEWCDCAVTAMASLPRKRKRS